VGKLTGPEGIREIEDTRQMCAGIGEEGRSEVEEKEVHTSFNICRTFLQFCSVMTVSARPSELASQLLLPE
jgi:hypothetical protein